METSNIILYENCKLKPEKNFMADNISDFLNDCTSNLVVSNQQYIKHNLNLEVKLISPEYPSGLSLSYNQGKNYNYCSIKNTNDTKPIYYFIINKEWISVKGLKLQLVMDTLNSFKINEDYSLSPKTYIQRQHKDRFYEDYHLKEYTYNNYSELLNTFVISKDITFPSSSTTINGKGKILKYMKEGNKYVISYHGEIKDLKITMNSSGFTIIYGDERINVDSTYKTDSEYIGWCFTLYYSTATTNILFYKSGKFEGVYLKRNIDFYSEKIYPTLYNNSSQEINQVSNDLIYASKWYMIFISDNSETNAPVSTYIMPELGNIRARQKTASNLDISSFTDGVSNCFGSNIAYTNTKITYTISGLTGTFGINATDKDKIYYVRRIGDKLYLSYIKRISGVGLTDTAKDFINIDYQIIDKILVDFDFKVKKYTISGISAAIWAVLLANINDQNITSFIPDSYTDGSPLSPFNNFDTTNPLINKIIELPYCPIPCEYKDFGNLNIILNNDVDILINLDLGWKVSGAASKISCISLHKSFTDNLINTVNTNINNKEFLFYPERYTDNRELLAESKMFHSDFYNDKFVYDSFVYPLHYENFTEDSIDDSTLKFNFVMSKTMNSRFLFDFNNLKYKYNTEDYPTILNVVRNNEVPFYSSAYLNYLRTDYNYDAKKYTLDTIKSIYHLPGNIYRGMKYGASQGMSAGPIGAAVGAVIGMGVSGADQIMESINMADDFAQKQKRLKDQKVSVEQCDDVDLLNYYTNQRAKLVNYKVDERTSKALNDIFYYTGYIVEAQGKPDLHTRANWDYCQCNPDIINNKNIPDEILNNITMRMQNGFTLFHNNKDLKQENENREIWRYF